MLGNLNPKAMPRYSEELILQSRNYLVRMEEVHTIMWMIQDISGKKAALKWRDEHLARFN